MMTLLIEGWTMSSYEVLALGLEGTLVSRATCKFPRPGLKGFLDFCFQNFPEVVLFSSAEKDRVAEIVEGLLKDSLVPPEMKNISVVPWEGDRKDLKFVQSMLADFSVGKIIGTDQILFVEDQQDHIEPSQKKQWIPVKTWETPYPDNDNELGRVQKELAQRLGL
jgi:hypothetical protein